MNQSSLFRRAQHLVAENFSGQKSFWKLSSIHAPTPKLPSVSLRFVPPGAKQNKSNHSSLWQHFRYLNKVIMYPQSILFSKVYILKSFLNVAHIPGPSVSWLSLWHPGLKTRTQSVAEHQRQRSTCYLCRVFISEAGSFFVLKLIMCLIK